MRSALLLVEGLSILHDGRDETIGPLDLSASAGLITALSGPSGAGKTTLISAIAGLIPRAAGPLADRRHQADPGAEPTGPDPAGVGVIEGRIVLPGPVRLVPQAPAFVAGTAQAPPQAGRPVANLEGEAEQGISEGEPMLRLRRRGGPERAAKLPQDRASGTSMTQRTPPGRNSISVLAPRS